MIADHFWLSPIIAMVAYAMTAARIAPRRMGARNRVSTYSVWETAVFVLNVLAFVIMGLQARLILNRLSRENLSHALLVSAGVLVSWCGMRGLVTLATAFALPPGFPGRDLIVLCAFCVVLGTLVIQGFTLRPLLHWLDFKDDGTVERELSAARVSIMQAALDSLDGDTSPAAAALRDQYHAARTTAGDESAPQAASAYDQLRLRAI